MIKKLFFISTLFLLTSFSASSSLTETKPQQTVKTDTSYLLELYENDKWGFMGKKFIDELGQKDKNYDLVLISNMILLCLDPLIIMLSLSAIDYYSNSHLAHDELIITALFEIALLFAVHVIITNLLNKRIDKKTAKDNDRSNYLAIKNFLKNWETYKQITPKGLCSLFEKLIQNFDELCSRDNARIIGEIQQQVRNNNFVYYEKYKKPLVIIR